MKEETQGLGTTESIIVFNNRGLSLSGSFCSWAGPREQLESQAVSKGVCVNVWHTRVGSNTENGVSVVGVSGLGGSLWVPRQGQRRESSDGKMGVLQFELNLEDLSGHCSLRP